MALSPRCSRLRDPALCSGGTQVVNKGQFSASPGGFSSPAPGSRGDTKSPLCTCGALQTPGALPAGTPRGSGQRLAAGAGIWWKVTGACYRGGKVSLRTRSQLRVKLISAVKSHVSLLGRGDESPACPKPPGGVSCPCADDATSVLLPRRGDGEAGGLRFWPFAPFLFHHLFGKWFSLGLFQQHKMVLVCSGAAAPWREWD